MFFRRDRSHSGRRSSLGSCVWGSTGMEVAISSARASGTYPARDELTAQQMIEIYRLMFLSRAVDDREILLKHQQKSFFQISSAGHEALQVGAALGLRPGYDWFFPYYRDGALALALGVTPYDMMLQAVAARRETMARRSGALDLQAQSVRPKIGFQRRGRDGQTDGKISRPQNLRDDSGLRNAHTSGPPGRSA